MLYFSLDTETTSLDSKTGQIIEFGAIFEDTNILVSFKNIPKFKRIIQHDSYVGSAVAIHMNARIFKILAEYDKIKSITEKEAFRELHGIIRPEELMPQFRDFVIDCYMQYEMQIPDRGINVVGKNFAGHDGKFIEPLNQFRTVEYVKINHVIGDPATLYVNWKKDEAFPGLGTCKERAGFDDYVSHDALTDSWDVIQILRKKY